MQDAEAQRCDAPPTSSPTTRPTTDHADHAAFFHNYLAHLRSTTAAAPASGAAAPASAAHAVTLADTICQCLMIDASSFPADSERAASFAAALLLSNSALISHMLQLLPTLERSSISVMIPEPAHRRIHIHFLSHSHLAAALLRAPQLMRCAAKDAEGESRWKPAAVQCGVKRHELPELLQLSCVLSSDVDVKAIVAAVTKLCSDNNIGATTIWVKRDTHLSTQQPANKNMRVRVGILPRNISDEAMLAIVILLHDKCNAEGQLLLGRKWLVHAPNTPALRRCSGCDTLGHSADRCTLYDHPAFRLLFSKPMPYQLLEKLIAASGAHSGYLGASLDQRFPSCKVTLLFHAASFDIQDAGRRALDSLVPVLGFVLACCPVDTKHRSSECAQCNHRNGAHECVNSKHAASAGQRSYGAAARGTVQQRSNTGAAAHPQPAHATAATAASKSASSSASSAAAAPGSGMCHQWRRTKTCVRLSEGRKCSFDHPSDYVLPDVQPCYDFSIGQCRREHCKYTHDQPQQQRQQQQRAATAACASSAASASSSSSSAAAPSGPASHAAAVSNAVSGATLSAGASVSAGAAPAQAQGQAESKEEAEAGAEAGTSGAHASSAGAGLAVGLSGGSKGGSKGSGKHKGGTAAATAAGAAITAMEIDAAPAPATPSRANSQARAAAAAAAPASAPAAAQKRAGRPRKRGRGEDAAASPDSSPAPSAAPKQRLTAASRNLDSAFTSSTNSFAALQQDDDMSEQVNIETATRNGAKARAGASTPSRSASSTAPTIIPPSSLSSLASPTKLMRAVSASRRGKDASASSSTATAASSAAASSHSSSSGPQGH